MNKKMLTVLIALSAVAILSGVGIGYALYQGGTYSENNTSNAVVSNTVDIWVYNGSTYGPLNAPITVPAFQQGQPVSTSEYRLVLSGGGSVYLICHMGNGACWPLIESMSLSINNEDYFFGVGEINNVPVTGIPTETIPLTSTGHTFETDEGDTMVYYDFTISIRFSDIDITADPNWAELSTFAGSQFEFIFVPE